MLPAVHRMRDAADFTTAVRRGHRIRRGALVLHVCSPAIGARAAGLTPRPATVGFVVARSVGNSVVRHRVARRLRGVVAQQLPNLEPGTLLVVRALPESARVPSARLAADLTAALGRVR